MFGTHVFFVSFLMYDLWSKQLAFSWDVNFVFEPCELSDFLFGVWTIGWLDRLFVFE